MDTPLSAPKRSFTVTVRAGVYAGELLALRR